MAISFRESRRLERRKRNRKSFQRLLVILGLGLIGMLAYVSGKELAQQETRTLRAEIRRLSDQLQDLRVERQALETARLDSETREADMAARYERDVPTGDLAEIFRLAKQRLDAGLAPDRLALVIRTAGDGRDCANEPDTKRFIVRTPIYRGGNDWVGFANTQIVVRATGESDTDGAGRPQQLYDPVKPVTVSFTHIDGGKSEASGQLPLTHSIVRGDTEYRFNITEGVRGFADVTMDRCAYP